MTADYCLLTDGLRPTVRYICGVCIRKKIDYTKWAIIFDKNNRLSELFRQILF